MGIWDFFRKKKSEVKAEKLNFSEVNLWVQKKKEELEKQEENFLKDIKTKLRELISELEQEKEILKQVNVNNKKAEEKIKFVVKENLENCTYYLEKLLERLKGTSNEPRKNIVDNINSAFSDFHKRSAVSYEKATFLIGKELGSVKESIRNFFRGLEKILRDNQGVIDNLKIIDSVEKNISKLNEIRKIKLEVEKKSKEYLNRTENIKESTLLKKEEIEKIKKSTEFIEEEKKKQELQKKEQELEEGIGSLKEIVDFKALAGFYHSFEKEMAIVKCHRENFKRAFQKTSGQELLNLLIEAKMQNEDITNKIQEIEEKKKEIQEIIFNDFGIPKIEQEIKELNSDVENINTKKLAEEKKLSKLEGNLRECIGEVKGQLIKMDVEVK